MTSFPPTPIRLESLRDFTGGWNLRANAFQLQPNESQDMLDVTVEIGGGFVQRNVVSPFGSAALPANVLNTWAFSTPSVNQVVVGTATNLYYGTGGAWTLIGAFASPQKPRAAVFANNLYVVGGAVAPLRWTGSAASVMGATFNETIGTEGAADGNMPQARYICSHASRVWIAYTTESATDFPNRIRWSHAGFAEDWRAEDFIDIDAGRDGDVITGIVEFRDRLYVFKNHSISVVTGYSTANFAVTTVSQDIGAVSQEAICVTDVGLFNFSWPQGVYLDKGNGPYPIFDKLAPLIRDGWIPAAYRGAITMGWVNQMLWCSIPYQSAGAFNTRTIVYNPWIFKNRWLRFLQGPWYPHSLGISSFVRWQQTNGATLYLASQANGAYVGQLEQSGSQDNWGGGLTNISSYYKTSWVDAGSASVSKRWRRPDIVMRNNGVYPLTVEVRKDYDPQVVYRVFQALATGAVPAGLIWDDGTGTVGGKWDDGTGTVGGNWGAQASASEIISHGGSMGTGRAIQLNFLAPTGKAWGVDAIDFKYIPKRLRG